MTGSRNEAYGAFAWAYDEALGKSFFATVEPLLISSQDHAQTRTAHVIDRGGVTGRPAAGA